MTVRFNMKNVRLAFPNLFEPFFNDDGKGSYGAKLIFPDHPQVPELVDAMRQAAVDAWGPKAGEIYKGVKAANKLCLHDGAEKADYAGFEGNLFLSANNKDRPLLIDGNKQELAASSGKLYAGAYANVSLDIWTQDNKYGKRINAGLRGVQHAADGERLAGGGTASENEFEEIPGSGEASEAAASADFDGIDPFG